MLVSSADHSLTVGLQNVDLLVLEHVRVSRCLMKTQSSGVVKQVSSTGVGDYSRRHEAEVRWNMLGF